MKIYIGFDPREEAAFDVAVESLHRVAPDLQVTPLDDQLLRAQGLYWRPVDHRSGQDYDITSNEQTSTRFKCTRFLTPLLAQTGRALFVDCDVVFCSDPREMVSEAYGAAVSVVKHKQAPLAPWKMVNQSQRPHPLKWWSSVMLFDCSHPANQRLSLRDVNERTAWELNNFYWLHDNEIGELWQGWNWLVDVQPRPQPLHIAHMTLGGPWLPGWQGGSFDAEWRAVRAG